MAKVIMTTNKSNIAIDDCDFCGVPAVPCFHSEHGIFCRGCMQLIIETMENGIKELDEWCK